MVKKSIFLLSTFTLFLALLPTFAADSDSAQIPISQKNQPLQKDSRAKAIQIQADMQAKAIREHRAYHEKRKMEHKKMHEKSMREHRELMLKQVRKQANSTQPPP